MDTSSWVGPFIRGFGLGAGLIIAIGAQNAFVLRQGVKREYVFAVALTCSICDAVLIALGCGGFGSLIAAFPALVPVATWGGSLFLFFYGARAFLSALHPKTLSTSSGPTAKSLKQIISLALAFSLLNPHVYLDTVVLLGSLGAAYPAQLRFFFGLGAVTASFVWFFSLAFGAILLAPLFTKSSSWRILDFLIGCTMWLIAGSLVFPLLA